MAAPRENSGRPERAAYNHPGVVITAATGDEGYDGWAYLNEGDEPPGRPDMPASLPSVVAVGGTTLELNGDGKRASERVWNGNGPADESEFAEGATGGGCSTLFTAEPWQQDVPGFGATGCGSKRLAADVSAVADPHTGFDIYDSYNCGEECEYFKGGKDWLTIGGTSVSTPLISALYALAGGSNGVSYPSLTLYGHLGDSRPISLTSPKAATATATRRRSPCAAIPTHSAPSSKDSRFTSTANARPPATRPPDSTGPRALARRTG